MSRELKFKAWNRKEKVMSDEFGFEAFDGTYFIPRGWYLKDMDIFQDTGLKDKNGKPIYEGDIVDEFLSDAEDENYLYHGIVEYLGCGFALKIKDKSFIELRNTGHNLEIIGNIYKHPHLLENK